MKHDAGKIRMELLPFDALEQVAAVLTFGAVKYEPDRSCFSQPNWLSVPNAGNRYAGALLRHVSAWLNGEAADPESGLHHLAHAATNALFLLSILGRDGKLPPIDQEKWKKAHDEFWNQADRP